ncbi:hypothetical protein [Pseudomonas costantinii]|uniref:Uncharacterized protein n=1 Tax=Pseudomonas costantinii TaxID=168469 RepID=A0A1S2URN7_9PSED|nr:hypothetical protein [Pseudomonas costantinii]NVZ22434.1 hypothetical protein [Pseudomonas costantinii]OIN48959.1 hypothetical protein BFL40_23700 [Pseudomonas costantinii]SEE14425.1 hypothetical protein SAMN04515675_4145 [Pseudomonas costantinii]
MWTTDQYRTLVRASAWYDLIVTAAFVTPWSFLFLHSLLQGLNLPGEFPPFAPAHVLMANLLGSIVCVWAVLRIRDPQRKFGLYDAAGRVLFATWQLYALMHGATSVLWGILLFEVLWGIAQLWPVRADQKTTGA